MRIFMLAFKTCSQWSLFLQKKFTLSSSFDDLNGFPETSLVTTNIQWPTFSEFVLCEFCLHSTNVVSKHLCCLNRIFKRMTVNLFVNYVRFLVCVVYLKDSLNSRINNNINKGLPVRNTRHLCVTYTLVRFYAW